MDRPFPESVFSDLEHLNPEDYPNYRQFVNANLPQRIPSACERADTCMMDNKCVGWVNCKDTDLVDPHVD